MLQASILEIAQDVANEANLGIHFTSLFAGYNEGDTTDKNLLRAATKTARFLLSYWAWPELTSEHQWTTVAGQLQPASITLPPDFYRLVPRTLYDVTNKRPIREVNANEWARRYEPRFQTPCAVFRMKGVELETPYQPGAIIRYSYIGNNICKSGAPITPSGTTPANPCDPVNTIAPGTLKPKFTNDDDIPLWDAELFHLGMLWTVMHRNGATNNEDYQAFIGRLHEVMNHEAADTTLNMGLSSETEWHEDHVDYPAGLWGNN